MDLIIDNDIFKQFKDTAYYVNRNGDVYSMHVQRIISGQIRIARDKPYKYIDILNKETHKQQHVNVHRMVFSAWVRDPLPGEIIRHLNDNSLDNRLDNLAIGTQKENIADCIANGNRIGNVFYLTVKDKELDKIITFCPAHEFIAYSGHSNSSGSLNKFFNKRWFQKRYEIIEFKSVNNLKQYQSVTTRGDECSLVG